jgi:hypothetical protein
MEDRRIFASSPPPDYIMNRRFEPPNMHMSNCSSTGEARQSFEALPRHACTRTHAHTRMHAYTHTRIHAYTHTPSTHRSNCSSTREPRQNFEALPRQACTHTHAHTRMHTSRIHAYTHILIHHPRIHAFKHTHMYAYTHTPYTQNNIRYI